MVNLPIDPNKVGEYLRDESFIKVNKFDYGCYSTFELQPNFKQITGNRRLRLLGKLMNFDFCCRKISENLFAYVRFDNNQPLIIAWYWDGDGTLLFATKSFIIINTDCKKDDCWEQVTSGKDLTPLFNFTDLEKVLYYG
jgi:hypothetical protein